MREVIFRGQRENNGKWVYGSFDTEWGVPPEERKCCWIIQSGKGYIEVKPETVGRYSGLTDKDGRKIFDGDIIKSEEFNAKSGYGVVEFDDGVFEITAEGLTLTFFEDYWGDECEVIGNIFDNPELV